MSEAFVSVKTSYTFDSTEETEYLFCFDAGLRTVEFSQKITVSSSISRRRLIFCCLEKCLNSFTFWNHKNSAVVLYKVALC